MNLLKLWIGIIIASLCGCGQNVEKRVEKLIKEYCDDWYNNDINILRERCFMIDDETENMC